MAIKNTNPRIGTTKNLESGGTFDLLLIKYPDGFPEGQLLFDIDMTPRKITGLQKVAQVFLKVLMTSKGSDVIYPNRGTNFPSLALNSNVIENDTVLYAELTSAVKDAEGQTKAALNSAKGDTASMMDRVEIIRIAVSQDSIVMFLYMQTLDGTKAKLAIPFPELDLV